MSDEEVDELLKAVDTSSGEINYTGSQLIRSLPILLEAHCSRSRPDHPCELNGSMQ